MRRSISTVASTCLMLVWTACGQRSEVDGGLLGSDDGVLRGHDAGPNPIDSGGGFISDVPPDSLSWPGDGDGDGDEGPGGSAADVANDASHVVAEADIVQVHGDRLYAISLLGGLSIIDIGDLANLRVLGRYPSAALPFEMYVDGDRIIATYLPRYGFETGAVDVWTSSVLVLDASNPAEIALQAEIVVPGALSVSRRVGDLLYIVSDEDGLCSGCDGGSRTRVLSLDLSELPDVSVVDEVAFPNHGWQAPVAIAEQRLFVATRDTFGPDVQHAGIQVIDVSDPTGAMRLGSTIDTAGVIRSSWQMDEHEGVLRVISQGTLQEGEQPVVETFAIASSGELMLLGSTELVLPRPESLHSVRFDGDRGFALVSEEAGSLFFTLDLSDPTQPSQSAGLELSGWIENIDLQGNRVVAIGCSGVKTASELSVSLVDVSDIAAPTLLAREAFGGKYGAVSDAQERFHRVIAMDEAAGLILVAFASRGEESPLCIDPITGIQLIELSGDELHVGAVAQTFGYAARGFMLGERLVALCDERLRVYDLQDRAAPIMISQASLAFRARHFAVAGDRVVGLTESSVSGEVSVTIADQMDLNPVTRPLLDLFTDDSAACGGANGIVATETTAFIRSSPNWTTIVDITEGSPPRELLTAELPDATLAVGDGALVGIRDSGGRIARVLDVIDVRDRQKPRAVTLNLRSGTHLPEMFASGDLLFTQSEEPVGDGRARYFLETVDLSDPSNPRVVSTLNVPGRVIHVLDSAHALTLEAERSVIEDLEAEECIYGHLGLTEHQPYDESDWEGLGTCSTFEQTMHRVRLGADEAIIEASAVLAVDGLIVSKDFTSDTALLVVARAKALARNEYRVITVGGLSDQDLEQGSVPISDLSFNSEVPIAFLRDHQALLLFEGIARRFDVSEAAHPRPAGDLERTACGYGSVSIGARIVCRAGDGFASLPFTQ